MKKRIIAADCETDKFLYGRIPQPFIWGAYDGEEYLFFKTTKDFVEWARKQNAIIYAHNGGKFDWIYIIPFLEETTDIKKIGGRIAEMKLGNSILRDSYSIIPEPLAKIDKDEIDYDKFEEDVRHLHIEEITEYLKTDVYVLYVLVKHFREEAGNKLTIASNALSSAQKLGIKPGRTNFRFDEKMRQFYFGGRTECFLPGTFRNVKVYDIRSSYPWAMMQEHATGDRRVEHSNFNKIDEEKISSCFIVLECHSKGAFPLKTKDGLVFPEGKHQFYVTGWEFLIAEKYNLISDIKIIKIIEFDQLINFKPYVDKWFAYKEKHRPRRTLEEKAKYIIGKIMLNSLYGKMAMNPLKFWDYKFCELGEEINSAEGWQKYAIFQDKEVHRRSVKWNVQYKYGKEWQKKPLYYNVATGASITGLARANLLNAMCQTGFDRVIYCDTDSMAIMDGPEPPIDLSKNLGSWDLEFSAHTSYFAGKKLYAMRGKEPGSDQEKEKIASKGSILTFANLRDIVSGRTIEWRSEAPTFSIAFGKNRSYDKYDENLFVKRKISMTV